jgi:membrane protease YdiL (CAAX protease family)
MGEASEARRYGADLSTRARITARSVLIGATVFASLVLFGLTILVVYVIRLIRRPPESRAPIDGLLLLPVWIVFIGWQFIESGVHILLLELVGIDSLRSPSGILLLKALSSGAGCALLFGVVLTASGFAARDLGISFKVSLLSRFAAGLAGFLVAVPTVFSVSLLSQYLLKNPGISSNPIFDLLLQGSPPAGTIYIILAVCLVAPFFEEVMFRAFLYSALKSRWGTGKATAASAFLFALVHGETAILLPVFTLGLILAWLYERSGSLWPSVVCHALWNSTTIAFTLLILAP